MTPTLASLHDFSDQDLLSQLERAIQCQRQATAQVIALLMEVDARKLYAQQSCSSLFTYCVKVLHFSEHAAYLRIEGARAAKRFPTILERLTEGTLHLTAVSLLAPHLTAANHKEMLDAARHKSKREVEELVARVRPQSDVPAMVRRLPAFQPSAMVQTTLEGGAQPLVAGASAAPAAVAAPRAQPAAIRPLAPERFKVQFTVDRGTYDKLRQAQDLLRHSIPNGDPAVIFDRALTLLIAELSKTKFAETERPRSCRTAMPGSRHVPARVRREVWRRDEAQCAFRGERGRCAETGFLEFHHVVPYAQGGAATPDNIELRCRAHNVYDAEQQSAHGTSSFWVRESRADYCVQARLGPDRVHDNFALQRPEKRNRHAIRRPVVDRRAKSRDLRPHDPRESQRSSLEDGCHGVGNGLARPRIRRALQC